MAAITPLSSLAIVPINNFMAAKSTDIFFWFIAGFIDYFIKQILFAEIHDTPSPHKEPRRTFPRMTTQLPCT